MRCPKCSSPDFIKSGKIEKKQRYKCRACNCQFTQEKKPGASVGLKMFCVSLFLNGMSMNSVARLFDVAPPTIMRWVNYFKQKLGEDFSAQQEIILPMKKEDAFLQLKNCKNFLQIKHEDEGYFVIANPGAKKS